MKTYAESKGEKPFNWKQILEAAIENPKSVNADDHAEWKYLADHWPTCACGNQDVGIDRRHDGSPVDEDLNWAGREFSAYIDCGNWSRALAAFRRIELRAAEILSNAT